MATIDRPTVQSGSGWRVLGWALMIASLGLVAWGAIIPETPFRAWFGLAALLQVVSHLVSWLARRPWEQLRVRASLTEVLGDKTERPRPRIEAASQFVFAVVPILVLFAMIAAWHFTQQDWPRLAATAPFPIGMIVVLAWRVRKAKRQTSP